MAIDENTSFAEIALKLAQEADKQENTSTKTIEQYMFEHNFQILEERFFQDARVLVMPVNSHWIS